MPVTSPFVGQPALPRLRPLPLSVRPVLDETLACYLRRLAHTNQLDAHQLDLWFKTPTGRWTPHLVDQLAALSGQTPTALRYAILELNTEDELVEMRVTGRPRPGVIKAIKCSFCCHRRGITTPVNCWRRAEDVVCLRHRRWTGSDRALDLGDQPGILAANGQHRQLIRRHGRQAAFHAFNEASSICREWIEHRTNDQDFNHWMERFLGPTWQVDVHHPALAAAIYPQTVALTRLLADPHWRSLPLQGVFGINAFVGEVRRTVAPRYGWDPYPRYRHHEPLVRVFKEHRELEDFVERPPARFTDVLEQSGDLRHKE